MAELQLVDNTDAAAAHVLPVVASCPSPACVVYPYMPNGALSDRLRRRLGAPPLGYALRLRIALEIATALSYLHNKVSTVHGSPWSPTPPPAPRPSLSTPRDARRLLTGTRGHRWADVRSWGSRMRT